MRFAVGFATIKTMPCRNPKPETQNPRPSRAGVWQLRTRRLELPKRTLLMGVINVTPDSFSDGGRFFDPAAALVQALKLVDAGADLLDIGGESTRPYSEPISAEEELRRVLPVVEAVCAQVHVPVSIDTSKAAVARAAIEAGVEIINDVTALTGDPYMLAVAVETRVGVCAMHMQGTPQTMQDNPTYRDVVCDIMHFLRDSRNMLLAAGVTQDRICLDPGIGFGKTPEHNLMLLANCVRFHELGCPLMVGHSRKGFIGHVLGDKSADRLPGTIGVACALAAQGVQILRVHDIAPLRQALQLFAATGGLSPSTLVKGSG
jgi:dihydropteroate synthase